MLAPVLGATVATALAALLWVMAWRGWRKRVAMRQWPTAPASIRGYRTRISGRSKFIDVEVRYSHDGREYTVWCASPTGSGYGRDTPQALRQVATIFPKASTHPVYVNPARPDEAFLLLPEIHMLALLAGFGVILFGLAAQWLLPRVTAIDDELAMLGFMTLLGAVLSVLVVVLGIALVRTPLPRPFPRPFWGSHAKRTRPPRRRRRW